MRAEKIRKRSARLMALMIIAVFAVAGIGTTENTYAASKLGKTTITSAKAVSKSAVKVKWKKVKNASGYKIYRAKGKSGKFKRIKTIKKKSTVSYKDTGLKAGTKYRYKVRPYKKGKKGKYSEVVSVKTKAAAKKKKLTAPKNFKAELNGKVVTLTWDAVSGADDYMVERAVGSKSFSGKAVATTKKPTYEDMDLTVGKTYYYKVYAHRETSDEEFFSKDSEVISIKVIDPATLIPLSLDYSADGSSQTTHIETGMAWTDELQQSLAAGSTGEDIIYRPQYVVDNTSERKDAYCYCYDIGTTEGSYDNFLEVHVSEGEIIGWITNGDIIAKRGNIVYRRGTVAKGNGVFAAARKKASGCDTWFSDYPEDSMLIGYVRMYQKECEHLILAEEQRDACYMTNALRALAGRGPLTLNKYLCGDEALTYGAQAAAETLYQNKTVTHETETLDKGPVAGKDCGKRMYDIMKACNYAVICTGENAVGYGGEDSYYDGIGASFAYTGSKIHMAAIMYKSDKYFGIGIAQNYSVEIFGGDDD